MPPNFLFWLGQLFFPPSISPSLVVGTNRPRPKSLNYEKWQVLSLVAFFLLVLFLFLLLIVLFVVYYAFLHPVDFHITMKLQLCAYLNINIFIWVCQSHFLKIKKFNKKVWYFKCNYVNI